MSYNICITGGSLVAGGAERVMSILANSLMQEGHNVTILLWKDNDIFYRVDERVRIVEVCKETKSRNIVMHLGFVRRFMKQSNFDVVLSFMTPINIVTIISMLGLHQKLIISERSDPRYAPKSKMRKLLRLLLYRFANGLVAQTENAKRYFNNYGLKSCEVIYNPVNVDEHKVGAAASYQKSDEIVTVGRLIDVKNQELLLKAFKDFSKTHTSYKLTIYGEGPLRSYLECLVRNLGLSNKVNLPGVYTDVHDKICYAKLFVLTSNYEGMPNSLLEAMTLGLPCISTRINGTTDFIIDGENGVIVDVNNKTQLVDSMIRIADNYDLQHKYASKSQRVYDIINKDSIVKKWINYINIITEKG